MHYSYLESACDKKDGNFSEKIYHFIDDYYAKI